MQLYCAPPNTAADMSELLQAFARLPAGQDFVDGNQHDCQEFLHSLIDALHEDLVRTPLTKAGLHMFCSAVDSSLLLLLLLMPLQNTQSTATVVLPSPVVSDPGTGNGDWLRDSHRSPALHALLQQQRRSHDLRYEILLSSIRLSGQSHPSTCCTWCLHCYCEGPVLNSTLCKLF